MLCRPRTIDLSSFLNVFLSCQSNSELTKTGKGICQTFNYMKSCKNILGRLTLPTKTVTDLTLGSLYIVSIGNYNCVRLGYVRLGLVKVILVRISLG
jgi:hypothetical protein